MEYIEEYINDNVIPNLKENTFIDKKEYYNDFILLINNINNYDDEYYYMLKNTFFHRLDNLYLKYSNYYEKKKK